MNSGMFITIYFPIFILLFVILPTNNRNLILIKQLKKIRGKRIMSNEMIKSCIGKICTISTGSFGTGYSKVEVLEVVDNWMKVQKKGKIDFVNIDYIQTIKLHN